MAAPSYATDLVSINADAENTTSWSALGGGGAGLSADPDFAIEPTNSVTKQVTGVGTLKGMVYEYGSTRTQATNDHIYQWIYATCPGLIDTLAAGGMRVSVGTSDTALNEYYIRGSAEYAAGGWVCEPVRYDSAVTPSPGRQLGSPGSAPSSFGGQILTTGTIKAVNFSVDVCYEGSQIEITDGDGTTPATYERLTTYSYDTTRRWGVILPTSAGADLQGKLYWGTASTSCYARDSGKFVGLVDTPHSLTDLTEVIHANASSDQEFFGFTFQALGTNNRGKFSILNNAPVDYTGTVFLGIDTFVAGGTNSVLDNCTFEGTNEVTGAGGSFLGTKFVEPTVAADSYALLYNETADPNGELDGAEFTMGANDHHAIEFGTSAPTTMTLTDVTFTGFDETTDEQNDSTLNFLRTTGSTTVNIEGSGTAAASITTKTTGTHTVTVSGSVPVTITCKDSNGDGIEGINVRVEEDPGGTLVSNGATNSSGVYTFSFTASTPQDVKVIARQKAYRPNQAFDTIVSGTGLSLAFTMIDNPIVNLP